MWECSLGIGGGALILYKSYDKKGALILYKSYDKKGALILYIFLIIDWVVPFCYKNYIEKGQPGKRVWSKGDQKG